VADLSARAGGRMRGAGTVVGSTFICRVRPGEFYKPRLVHGCKVQRPAPEAQPNGQETPMLLHTLVLPSYSSCLVRPPLSAA
jgi:hypothetical protein